MVTRSILNLQLTATHCGTSLWKLGKSYNIAPGSPNQIDRMEAGMISHLGDTTLEDNPLELKFTKVL